MRGYPKYLNTKEDIDNIEKNHPEFKEQLKVDLQQILDEPNTVKKATSLIDPKDESKGYNTVDIANPNPRWKAMGFKNKTDIQNVKDKLDAKKEIEIAKT